MSYQRIKLMCFFEKVKMIYIYILKIQNKSYQHKIYRKKLIKKQSYNTKSLNTNGKKKTG